MAQLDLDDLADSLIAAGSGAFRDNWPAVEAFAVTEFQKIARQIVDIETGLAAGDFGPEVADALFRMQKAATTNVLLAMSGMTLLAVEAAINAVLEVVAGTVNAAVGFALL